MAETKERYKLLSGKHAGFDEEGNSKTFMPGDWLLLSKDQAKSFAGKVKSERILKAEADVAFAGLDPEERPADTRRQPYAALDAVDAKTQESTDEEEARANVGGDSVKPNVGGTPGKEDAAAKKDATDPTAKPAAAATK